MHIIILNLLSINAPVTYSRHKITVLEIHPVFILSIARLKTKFDFYCVINMNVYQLINIFTNFNIKFVMVPARKKIIFVWRRGAGRGVLKM